MVIIIIGCLSMHFFGAILWTSCSRVHTPPLLPPTLPSPATSKAFLICKSSRQEATIIIIKWLMDPVSQLTTRSANWWMTCPMDANKSCIGQWWRCLAPIHSVVVVARKVNGWLGDYNIHYNAMPEFGWLMVADHRVKYCWTIKSDRSILLYALHNKIL